MYQTRLFRVGTAFIILCLLVDNTLGAQVNRSEAFTTYIQKHYKEAIRQMKRYSIPASITMAQGLVETGAGKSTLATRHNNHFGIKCHTTWRGKTTYRNDDRPNECFRSYDSWEQSYEDHSLFLRNGRRYARLFALFPEDYKGWATGLQLAGYATNKGYANKLIKVIEDYELYTLDKGYLPGWMLGRAERESRREPHTSVHYDRPMRPSYLSYGLLYVLADPHDSYARIAEDMGISAKKLARYNDTPIDYPLEEGDIVYLQRKNTRAVESYYTYVVRVGDSMHSIAQRYGIRLDRLYKLNDKDEDYIPEEGDVLRLR